jgi:hypothetical protein
VNPWDLVNTATGWLVFALILAAIVIVTGVTIAGVLGAFGIIPRRKKQPPQVFGGPRRD